MAPVIGAQQTTRLIDKVMALDTVKDVKELAAAAAARQPRRSAEALGVPLREVVGGM